MLSLHFSDLNIEAQESTDDYSPTEEPMRERGSTITKKIPLSEFATLQVSQYLLRVTYNIKGGGGPRSETLGT